MGNCIVEGVPYDILDSSLKHIPSRKFLSRVNASAIDYDNNLDFGSRFLIYLTSFKHIVFHTSFASTSFF